MFLALLVNSLISLFSKLLSQFNCEKVFLRTAEKQFQATKMANFYKKWLEKNKKANTEALEINEPQINLNQVSRTNQITQNISTDLPSASTSTISADSRNDLLYENDIMQLTIEKTSFLRQKKFKLHDHLFHMKITLKNSNGPPPLLRNILEFLQIAFDHILQNIRPLYNQDDHNIAFLTLYQKPMINGLNTGGFDIQDSSSEMVQRLLSMLQQFLVSNQNLKLDKSFKVYLKVLSIQHMKHKQTSRPKKVPKRTQNFYTKNKEAQKKLFGSRVKPIKKYNYFWALDVPNSFHSEPRQDVFKDMCLLTGTILGLLQNSYYKSNRCDKRFLRVQYINSVNKSKQNRAGKVLFEELTNLMTLAGFNFKGPFELEVTMQKLSELYKCQFFVFDSVQNSNKLIYMYPEEYNDSLIPIYFYQPLDETNHLVFIRNLKSYFKANVKVCFGCKKTFLTHDYRHLCPKRQCCFSCRRFFQTEETYLHEKLCVDFCDKNITVENKFTCPICNVTCFSKHCFKGHKQLCNGKGTFGYKCLKCNKFTYRYSNQNGQNLKEKHQCNELKKCKFCRESPELDHLCKLKKELRPQIWPRLAFITMEYFDNSSENCLQCSELRKEKTSELLCPSHRTHSESVDEPILVLIYCEEDTGTFSKYEFQNFQNSKVTKTNYSFSFPYCENVSPKYSFNDIKFQRKTQDMKTNVNILKEKQSDLLTDKIFQLISSWNNTTFICQDEDSICFVSILSFLIIR